MNPGVILVLIAACMIGMCVAIFLAVWALVERTRKE